MTFPNCSLCTLIRVKEWEARTEQGTEDSNVHDEEMTHKIISDGQYGGDIIGIRAKVDVSMFCC